jgi:hypothetical protein
MSGKIKHDLAVMEEKKIHNGGFLLQHIRALLPTLKTMK